MGIPELFRQVVGGDTVVERGRPGDVKALPDCHRLVQHLIERLHDVVHMDEMCRQRGTPWPSVEMDPLFSGTHQVEDLSLTSPKPWPGSAGLIFLSKEKWSWSRSRAPQRPTMSGGW